MPLELELQWLGAARRGDWELNSSPHKGSKGLFFSAAPHRHHSSYFLQPRETRSFRVDCESQAITVLS